MVGVMVCCDSGRGELVLRTPSVARFSVGLRCVPPGCSCRDVWVLVECGLPELGFFGVKDFQCDPEYEGACGGRTDQEG